jgi:hypothetical protein
MISSIKNKRLKTAVVSPILDGIVIFNINNQYTQLPSAVRRRSMKRNIPGPASLNVADVFPLKG